MQQHNINNTINEIALEPRNHHLSNEVIVNKKGLIGKLKLGVKYIDDKMHKVDTVYVTFKDKSKRKFVWKL